MAAAANKESTGTGKSRTALLAMLVIAGVAGGIYFLGGGSDEQAAQKDYVDDDVVEVAPLVPAGNMSGASWRSAEQVREDRAIEDEQAGESVFDKIDWDGGDADRAYDKSVEETVKDIDGLGVYVAPADSAKKPPAKKKGTAK